ncbi:MAG: hypothetical protein AAGG72_07400 [Pseudomonadota bacterium]
MGANFKNQNDRTALRAAIAVQLRSLPKETRRHLASNDWQERELAEKAVARICIDGMSGFTVTRDPMVQTAAPSTMQ